LQAIGIIPGEGVHQTRDQGVPGNSEPALCSVSFTTSKCDAVPEVCVCRGMRGAHAV
jgi:hypothetical protein